MKAPTPGNAAPPSSQERTWTEAATLVVACVLPACLAAARVVHVPDAAHDGGTARVLDFEAQAWRAVDALVAGAFAALPLGTRAVRAALAAALTAGLAGGVVYALGCRVVRTCAATRKLGDVVAAIAAVSAVAAPGWQLESGSVGGSATGAVLALVPLALLAGAVEARAVPWMAVTLALAVAVGYEPLVGLVAVSGCATLVAIAPPLRSGFVAALRAQGSRLAAGAVLGLAPLLLALARARSKGVLVLPLLTDAWAGERGLSLGGAPLAFVRREIGWVAVALAVCGMALAMLVARARPLALALATVVVAGLGCGWLGSAHGPSRFGAPLLAAWAAASVLGAVAMQASVRAIAAARLPFAHASATMILVLELALPADAVDASLLATRERLAAPVWDDVAWAELPPRTVVLLTSPILGARARAARSRGALRDDIDVIPAYTKGAALRQAFAADASFLPLWRDLELVGIPSEAALTSLAGVRPLAMAYEPLWGRALGRHLVPAAVFDLFELEPRGRSDRRYALDAFTAERSRLAAYVARDAELEAASAFLLRARAIGIASAGDRELLARVVEDARAFARTDPVLAEIEARGALGRAATFDDLRP
jgi:hypothetical protein